MEYFPFFLLRCIIFQIKVRITLLVAVGFLGIYLVVAIYPGDGRRGIKRKRFSAAARMTGDGEAIDPLRLKWLAADGGVARATRCRAACMALAHVSTAPHICLEYAALSHFFSLYT